MDVDEEITKVSQSVSISKSKSLKLQIMSDLHIEFLDGKLPNITPSAPHIALLGKISVNRLDLNKL